MARIMRANPNHQKEAFARLLEKNPNHRSEAGKIGGKKGGAIGGRITGPKTIWKALEWQKEHPEERLKILRKFQEAGNKRVREHPKEATEYAEKGDKALRYLVASGKIKRNSEFR